MLRDRKRWAAVEGIVSITLLGTVAFTLLRVREFRRFDVLTNQYAVLGLIVLYALSCGAALSAIRFGRERGRLLGVFALVLHCLFVWHFFVPKTHPFR